MKRIEKEVVSSFYEQIEAIKKLKKSNPDSEIKFTLCTLNDEIEFKFIEQNINELKKIAPDDYQPNSCTALYDAVGLTFSKIRGLLKSNDQLFIAIFTDGFENASTDYSAKDIKYKLHKAEKDGWQVQFFCRYKDKLYYQKDLGLSDDLQYCIALNDDGLKAMEREIAFRLNKLADGHN